jgi:hypothetical protein
MPPFCVACTARAALPLEPHTASFVDPSPSSARAPARTWRPPSPRTALVPQASISSSYSLSSLSPASASFRLPALRRRPTTTGQAAIDVS